MRYFKMPKKLLVFDIKRQRKLRGWSQRELARRAGMHGGTVGKLEAQTYQDTHVSTLYAIARALDVTMDCLIREYTPIGF